MGYHRDLVPLIDYSPPIDKSLRSLNVLGWDFVRCANVGRCNVPHELPNLGVLHIRLAGIDWILEGKDLLGVSQSSFRQRFPTS